MDDFFKSEDFREIALHAVETPNISAGSVMSDIAFIANRLLLERGIIVSTYHSGAGFTNAHGWFEQPRKNDTHTAVLVAIRPICICHEINSRNCPVHQ